MGRVICRATEQPKTAQTRSTNAGTLFFWYGRVCFCFCSIGYADNTHDWMAESPMLSPGAISMNITLSISNGKIPPPHVEMETNRI